MLSSQPRAVPQIQASNDVTIREASALNMVDPPSTATQCSAGTSTLSNAQGDPDGCSAAADPAARFSSSKDPHSNLSDLPANADMLVLCPNEDTNPPAFALTGLPDAGANASGFLDTIDSSLQPPRDGWNEILPFETAPPASSLLSVRHDMGNDSLALSQSIAVDSNSSRTTPSVPSETPDGSVSVASVLLATGNDFLATATVDQIIVSDPPSAEHAVPIDWVQSDNSLCAVDTSCQLANSDSIPVATIMHPPVTEADGELPSELPGQFVNETAPSSHPIDLDPGKDSLSLSRTAAAPANFTDKTPGHTIPMISSSSPDSAMNGLFDRSTAAVDLALRKTPVFIMPEDRQSTQQVNAPAPISLLDLMKSKDANIGIALPTSNTRQPIFANSGAPASPSNPETSCESQNREFEAPAMDMEDVDMGAEDAGLDGDEDGDISMADEECTGLTLSKILGSAVYCSLKGRPVNDQCLLVNSSINSCYYTEGSLLQ
jgi:hypothetical protein